MKTLKELQEQEMHYDKVTGKLLVDTDTWVSLWWYVGVLQGQIEILRRFDTVPMEVEENGVSPKKNDKE